MVLTDRRGEMSRAYSKALRGWLAEGHDAGLAEARELGRTAIVQGVGAAEMSALHHDSVKNVLPDHPATAQALVAAAGIFFAESMTPFDAREGELRRSNAALRYQNDKRERGVQQLTQVVYNEAMQLLAAARLGIAEAAGRSGCAGAFDRVHELIETVENQLLACSDDLWPRVLDDMGPRAAVQNLCRRFSRANGWEMKLDLGSLPARREIGIALYKAVLEALNNIEQHARADRVRIWLYEENSTTHCFVQDNGVGFDVHSVLSRMGRQGSGLAAAAESVRVVGGTMLLKSVMGAGTEIKISIDLNAER
jgi:signal transduction histidine kinase